LTIGEFIDNIELLKTLIDGKADIHANDDEALIMAYGNDYEDVFRLFTNAKANIHAQDDEALRITSCQGHTYRY
jgi:methionine synthase II (cobalamin-independent)